MNLFPQQQSTHNSATMNLYLVEWHCNYDNKCNG